MRECIIIMIICSQEFDAIHVVKHLENEDTCASSFGGWKLNNSQLFSTGKNLSSLPFVIVIKIYSSRMERRQLSGLRMQLCEQKI